MCVNTGGSVKKRSERPLQQQLRRSCLASHPGLFIKPNADVTPDASHMSGMTGEQGSLLQDDPFVHEWLDESRPGQNRSRAVTQDVNTATRKGLFSVDWPKCAKRSAEGSTSRHPDAGNKKVDSSRGPRFGKLEAQQLRLAWAHIGSCGIISRTDPKPQEPKAQRGLYLSWAGPLSNTPLFPYKSSRTTAAFRCNIHQTVRLKRPTQQTVKHMND